MVHRRMTITDILVCIKYMHQCGVHLIFNNFTYVYFLQFICHMAFVCSSMYNWVCEIDIAHDVYNNNNIIGFLIKFLIFMSVQVFLKKFSTPKTFGYFKWHQIPFHPLNLLRTPKCIIDAFTFWWMRGKAWRRDMVWSSARERNPKFCSSKE